MKAFVTYADVYQLLPSDRVCERVFDLTGHRVSEATLYAAEDKLAQALEPFQDAVRKQLLESPVVHFDESGLCAEGKLHWLHSASTETLTDYMVHARRGVEAMRVHGILPTFAGVAVHDGWPPYRTFQAARHALCNAHHEREFLAVAEHDGQPWAKALIDHLHVTKAAVATAALVTCR